MQQSAGARERGEAAASAPRTNLVRPSVALCQEEPQPRSEPYADPGGLAATNRFSALLTQSQRARFFSSQVAIRAAGILSK